MGLKAGCWGTAAMPGGGAAGRKVGCGAGGAVTPGGGPWGFMGEIGATLGGGPRGWKVGAREDGACGTGGAATLWGCSQVSTYSNTRQRTVQKHGERKAKVAQIP